MADGGISGVSHGGGGCRSARNERQNASRRATRGTAFRGRHNHFPGRTGQLHRSEVERDLFQEHPLSGAAGEHCGAPGSWICPAPSRRPRDDGGAGGVFGGMPWEPGADHGSGQPPETRTGGGGGVLRPGAQSAHSGRRAVCADRAWRGTAEWRGARTSAR